MILVIKLMMGLDCFGGGGWVDEGGVWACRGGRALDSWRGVEY